MDSKPSISTGITRGSDLVLSGIIALWCLCHSWNPLSQVSWYNETCKTICCLSIDCYWTAVHVFKCSLRPITELLRVI